MKSRSAFIHVVVCLLAVVTGLQAQERPKLSYEFSAGETLRYRVTQSATVAGGAGDAGAFEMQTEQVTEVAWKVESIDAGGAATIAQTVTKLKFTNSSPVGEVGFDSQSDEPAMGVAAMLTPAARTLLETPVTFTVSPTGRVGSIKASQDLIGALERVPGAEEVLEGEPALRALIEAVLPPLPGGEERVTKRTLPATGKLEMRATSKVDGPQADGSIVLLPRLAASGPGLRAVETGGRIELLAESRLPRRSEVQLTVELKIDPTTVKLTQKTTVERL